MIVQYLIISGGFAYLFYRSWIVFVVFCTGYPIYRARKKRQLIHKRQDVLCRQFKDSIQCAASAMAAGYSIENAFREAYAELQIRSIPNLIRLETRTANTEGVQEITIRDLIRTSLRMRPNRIIVGECRGAETLDMLQAMNTGHDGSISTGHANSSTDMLKRIETMVLMGMDLPLSAIRGQIASGIQILIHLGRLRDCSRKVLNVDEIDGIKDGEIRLHSIYRFVESKQSEQDQGKVTGRWEKTGKLLGTGKLREAGIYERKKKEDTSKIQ